MLLNAPQTELCLTCHAKEIRRDDESIVASVAEVANPDYHAHGPVAEGRCSDCHNPHGASVRALLPATYTQAFYQSYEPEAYALCFTCHEDGLVTEERTTTATGFRNGDRNLHHLHVAAEGASGRSCRVCHNVHAGPSRRLLRDSIAFGEWTLPVEHTLTETGGGCAAGCHRARLYDREQPASYLPAPTARSSASEQPSAPAETPQSPPSGE
jgi:predicted CXXCH cytochrome family protein